MINRKIAVLGLGYVGLPLAIELSLYSKVVGFDINKEKINNYKSGIDATGEIEDFHNKTNNIEFTSSTDDLRNCNFYIVTVPTPINKDETPDLSPLKTVSQMIATVLNKGDIVVYESTVYPGTTEEVCVPILEEYSKLRYLDDFTVGYSPERINPGDKNNTIRTIQKIISASNNETLEIVNDVYSQIIDAGLHKTSSIKIAEASKVIENAQRDINIAFFNEIAIVFDLMDINTNEVIQAAKTKWNFLPYSPGLVGGHCIGVDPYYFIYKAKELGYSSELLKTSRMINNSIPRFIVDNIVKEVFRNKLSTENIKVGIMGLTFKENCNDTRNSKVFDIIDELNDYNISPLVYDPYIDTKTNFDQEYQLVNSENFKNFDIVIIAVKHDDIIQNYSAQDIQFLFNNNSTKVLFDLKESYNKSEFDEDLIYWSL